MHEIIYIILAHKNPEQVKRLIRKVAAEHVHIYVHVDLNSELDHFIETSKGVCFLTKRVYCSWGDFSIVEATLNCIKKIIADNRHGHVILLSGQDYPIRSNENIKIFFQNNKAYDFIDCKPIKEAWPNNYIYRIQAHKINFSGKKNDFIYLPTAFTFRPRGILKNSSKLVLKALHEKKLSYLKLLIKIFIKKKAVCDLDFFGGSQWWALRTSTLSKIIEFIEANKEFSTFFKDSLIPDELFFQTAIAKIYEGDISSVKPKIMHLGWSNSSDLSPRIFLSNDLVAIKKSSSENLFARKFDQNIDIKILDELDIMTLEISAG